MRVFINGFGRIGRSVLRAYMQAPTTWPMLEIVGINDIAAADMCAYLFEYDSIYGPWRGTVGLTETALVVNGHAIALHRTHDISTLNLHGVDVVMECTGRADTTAVALRGVQAGALRILVSGPSAAAEYTVVLGANEAGLLGQTVVSNASCTTNALAPVVRLIHENWGVITGSMTTIHCYTGSQPTTDAPAADYARSRAAALSMVPTTTSAQRLLDAVLPDIAGRIHASAVRVPTASVSAVDLCVMVDRPPTTDAVNKAFRTAGGVIGATDQTCAHVPKASSWPAPKPASPHKACCVSLAGTTTNGAFPTACWM
jgi:glyceraldehyde 3-phosphate dehydrogenase